MPATPASNRWPDDDPPAPGWWKASDGQWYPPSVTPGYSASGAPPPSAGYGYGSGPSGAPSAPGGYGSSGAPGTSGGYGYGFNPYGPPPSQQRWGVPAWSHPQSSGNGFSIAGIVMGAIALLFVPPLFGILGLVFGGIGLSKKEKLAPVAMIVSGLGLVLGIILGVIVFTALGR